MITAASARTPLFRTGHRVRLPEGWPLYFALLGFPLWFLIGLGAFILPLFALPMLFSLLMRDRVELPRGLGWWFLFVGWTLVTALRLDTISRVLVFGYRTSLYLAATVFFVYVFNMDPRVRIRVVRAMAWFFLIVVAFGIVDLVVPKVTIHTLVESLLPRSAATNSWIHSLVVGRFAQIQALVYGQPAVARPAAPFAYTNDWGAMLSLLLPFAIAAALTTRRYRAAAWVAICISVLPLVASGNRGAWLSVVAGLTYAAIRYALNGHLSVLAGLFLVAVIAASAFTYSSLGGVVETRAIHTGSNQGRLAIYRLALDGVRESPVFGFGTPRPSATDPRLPDLGTHGQIWMVLYSHGLPGAVFYVGFLTVAFIRTRRARSTIGFWCHVTLFMGLLQMFFYQALPNGLFVIMIAAALAWSEASPEAETTKRVAARELAPHGTS